MNDEAEMMSEEEMLSDVEAKMRNALEEVDGKNILQGLYVCNDMDASLGHDRAFFVCGEEGEPVVVVEMTVLTEEMDEEHFRSIINEK